MRPQWLAGIAVITAACGPGIHPSTSSQPAPASSSPLVTSPSAPPTPTLPPGKEDSTSTPYPASVGPYVVDLSWVSDSMGWALAAVPCAGQLCPAVAETTDGGVTWQGLPSPSVAFYGPEPPPTADCQQVACVSHIRFATASIGYLFGPSLFMTVDGGQTWKEVTSPLVESLEAAGGDVFRVVYDTTGCPGPCNRTVQEAPAGSDAWQTLYQIPQGADLDTATLILEGESIYLPIYGDVAKGAEQTTLFRSLDGGQTWQRLGDPCAGATPPVDVAFAFAAASRGFLSVLCFPSGQPQGWAVLSSSDAGSTWGPRLPVPESSAGLLAAPSPGHLLIASPTGAGGGLATSTLSYSSDGGQSWSTAASDQVNLSLAPVGLSLWLGFEDVTTGRWVGDDRTIWTTTDGGTDWTSRSFAIG